MVGKQSLWAFFGAVMLGLSGLQCNQDPSGPGGADTAYIKFIRPSGATSAKLSEEFMVVTESDYDKFKEKLSFDATTDSGKSWTAFILALEPKTGMNVRDTVRFKFSELGLMPGEKTKIRAIEYGQVHYAISDFIQILPDTP